MAVRDTILTDGKLEQEVWQKLELDKYNIGTDDAKACFAAVNFIMTNSCKYQVEISALFRELEQLGLPSEHSQKLCDILSESGDEIRMHIETNRDST